MPWLLSQIDSVACDHVYSSDCFSCGSDASYNWITCSKYKTSGCHLLCVSCGEIQINLKAKDNNGSD